VTRAGIVAVIGKPNVGKSTLLNRLVGQKLAITSAKPQSTRDRVTGILTMPGAQIVLVDTPGLLDPKYPLQYAMRAAAVQALEDADVVLYLVDATEPELRPVEEVAGLGGRLRAPVVMALNKVDLLSAAQRQELAERAPNALLISAATGEGISALVQRLVELLPHSPFLYPEDDVSTQNLRFFVAELIRETALEQLSDEVPYAIACQVEEFREERHPVYIRATIYVERESQKRIVIGQGGSRIREIGKAARAKIEELVGTDVYLDLWVKVLPNWRRDVKALQRLGYRVPEV
jgi:GTP-binding protein Era